jgi:c-di-GMP-binding flagellar brake protein YcgR
MPELRKYTRLNAEGTVILRPKNDTSRSIKADLVDISFYGMGVYTQEKLEADTDVKLELIAKLYNEPIIMEGRIKYAKEIKRQDKNVVRIGIEFISTERKDIQYLMAHIQANKYAKLRRERYPK